MRGRLDVVNGVEVVIQADLAHARAQRVVERRLHLGMDGVAVVGGAIRVHPHQVGEGGRGNSGRADSPRPERGSTLAREPARSTPRRPGSLRSNRPPDRRWSRFERHARGGRTGQHRGDPLVIAPKRAQVGMGVVQRRERARQREHLVLIGKRQPHGGHIPDSPALRADASSTN